MSVLQRESKTSPAMLDHPETGNADPVVAPEDVQTPPTEIDATPVPIEVGVPQSSRWTWWTLNVIVPLVVLLVIGLVVLAWGKIAPSTRPPADTTVAGRLRSLPAVRTVPIESLAGSGQPLRLNADGTVVPYREVVVATEVNGRVIEKSPLCEAGKYVTAGTMLMKIDPTDYEFTVERLQRMQEQEYVALGEVDQEMVNTRRSMEIANADIELQRREVKRLESLPNNFASRGEIDQARRALLAAEQQKVNYQNQLDLMLKRRSRLEAAERLAATQLKAAEVDLQRTTITAPIDGVIVMENAELNTFVARGNPVVTMEDTSKVEVAAKLRSDQLYWVLNQKIDAPDATELTDPRLGEDVRGYRLPPTPVRVMYQVAGREDVRYVWKGKLMGYDGIGLDEQTRTVPVRVLVEKPREFTLERKNSIGTEVETQLARGPSALLRGMFVNLQLELQPAMPLVVIPAEALRPGNRVWEFVDSDDVLDVAAAKEVEAKPVDAPESWFAGLQKSLESWYRGESDVRETAVSPDAEDFDAESWTPGRLLVRENIRPVDWIAADGTLSGDSTPVDERISVNGKRWICEVPAGTLDESSVVVVSPLGSINAKELPVRAAR